MEYITEKNRIYAVEGGEEVGEVTFPERDDIYVINHTYVDDRLRGQGIASELVRRAVETIESRGGKVTGSVTGKTDYLINNDKMSSSSKNKKAKELGIPIISEDDFLKL